MPNGILIGRRGWSGRIPSFTSYDVYPRKDVPFGGFCWYTSPFRGSNLPTTVISGTWIGIFKPNMRTIQTHIIETAAWIPTKFCTPVKTTKYASWVVQKRGKQIQDGGRPPSWKIKNRDICATALPILMEFGTMMHLKPPDIASF